MQLCFLVVFPNQQEFSYLTCTVSSRTASRVQRKIQPGWHLPTLQLPFWWCNHNSASGEFNMDLCAERVQTGKTLMCSSNYPNENLSTWIILLYDTVTPRDVGKMEEKLYDYRHNNTDNVHNYSMVIQALLFYIMKQSLRLTLLLSPWHLSGIPEKVLLSFVSIDNQRFQHLKLPKSQPPKERKL